MTQSLHPAAAQGFSSAAALYENVRPSYPNAMTTWLLQELNLSSHSHILDLGAGTGKFLPYLQPITAHITAVEPITEMLAQLQQAFPEIATVQASSENLPFASESFDAVICAQSFHWFANTTALAEIYRVLKPNAHLGLIWNQRDCNIPWVKALAEHIAPLERDTPRYHSEKWKKVFENQNLFDIVNLKVFSQQHIGTVEQVVSKRLLSTSFIAALAQDEQQQLKQQFEKIVFDYTGRRPHEDICFPYQTFAYHFKKLP
jgi:ubiquinone/menaquinone biosynthesis C-methylase UbiE